jgi:hypothetical protein
VGSSIRSSRLTRKLLIGAAYGEVEDMTPLVMTRASREADHKVPAVEFDA